MGETIYNLRAAPDYLIYELAYVDSGAVQENTQFPITWSGKNWRRQTWTRYRPQRLRGINLRHRALIRALQPYRTVDWTKRLLNISNPDKHRYIRLVNYAQGSARDEQLARLERRSVARRDVRGGARRGDA